MRSVLIALVAMAVAAGAAAQTQIQKVPVAPTSPIDGKQMFQTYCAACHGAEARGNGPAAAALKQAPADLTKISARNGGIFPDLKVKRFIQGLDEVRAHGTREMPIWGDLFGGSLNSDTVEIRVNYLAAYLKSLQQ